nr:PREDICTED: zinc finger CCCH domain-containing protein 67-like [Daucus carota subsp. sativus]
MRHVNEQYGEVPPWYWNEEGDAVGRNGKAQYNKEPHCSGNAEKDSVGFNDGNFGSRHYPLRPYTEDYSFYMRTGTCMFGSICKFNHPLQRKPRASRDAFKQKEEIYDKPRQTECKYYLSAGGCKYRKACWYSHGKGNAAVTPNSELNFIGVGIYALPLSLKWRFSNKLFHHPNPTAAGGLDTTPR